MIHNSWGMVVGNQNDMREAASTFAEFDAAMADIYAARTGMKVAEVASLMDAETFMRAESAMEKGFADATFEAPEYDEKDKGVDAKKARARLDATLAKTGMPRVERRALLRDATGTPRAAEEAMPGAGLDVGALARLVSTIKP
jgi:hypothetical protein